MGMVKGEIKKGKLFPSTFTISTNVLTRTNHGNILYVMWNVVCKIMLRCPVATLVKERVLFACIIK